MNTQKTTILLCTITVQNIKSDCDVADLTVVAVNAVVELTVAVVVEVMVVADKEAAVVVK